MSVLREALGPSGVRARVMEAKVVAFFDEVNTNLRTGGKDGGPLAPPLVVDQEDWCIYKMVTGGKRVAAAITSDSQQLRHNLAIQVTIARRSGLNVVVADRMESMKPETVKEVINWLAAMEVQAFLFRVIQETVDGQDVKPDGQGFFAGPNVVEFWVERGNVERLTPVSVAA